mmetsp:Transcript_7046/g.6868  ORF Transcript_7046/g.6868 Transcript_7046/m.6868 type:complete len:121 (+) Transcript_7046:80-442(+)
MGDVPRHTHTHRKNESNVCSVFIFSLLGVTFVVVLLCIIIICSANGAASTDRPDYRIDQKEIRTVIEMNNDETNYRQTPVLIVFLFLQNHIEKKEVKLGSARLRRICEALIAVRRGGGGQ